MGSISLIACAERALETHDLGQLAALVDQSLDGLDGASLLLGPVLIMAYRLCREPEYAEIAAHGAAMVVINTVDDSFVQKQAIHVWARSFETAAAKNDLQSVLKILDDGKTLTEPMHDFGIFHAAFEEQITVSLCNYLDGLSDTQHQDFLDALSRWYAHEKTVMELLRSLPFDKRPVLHTGRNGLSHDERYFALEPQPEDVQQFMARYRQWPEAGLA